MDAMSITSFISFAESYLSNIYLFIYFQDVNPDSGYELKQKLYKHWLDVYNISGGNDFHSSRQRSFFSLCEYSQSDFHKCPVSLCQLCNLSSI